ncbi:uncharacterized protein [Mytilus edulis]
MRTFDCNKDVLNENLDEDFYFLDPSRFVAGNVHKNTELWGKILDKNQEMKNWIENFVDINNFMQPFKGIFWNVKYNNDYPPTRIFKNASNCEHHVDFINTELLSRLRSGAISYLGKLGEVKPPHIVSPITIEPLKPRLCINLMYLNCFMKDTPFNLDTLVDVPRTIKQNAYLTKLDDKSGYDNVFVTESSRMLLGFQWGGHYFCCNTLPFGWKNSAYVYHNLNLQAISFLRKKSISCLLYIDDRLIESFNGYIDPRLDNELMRSNIAIKYSVKLFVNLGYFLNIDKSVLIPTQSIVFLGMIIDSVKASFFITKKRKEKFCALRESILKKSTCQITILQKFVGICISLSLAIPGAKLYTSTCNRAISKAIKGPMFIIIDEDLRKELQYWSFIDNWTKPFPWVNERHNVLSLSLSSDASDYKWGAIFNNEGVRHDFSDYWNGETKDLPIMVKEALALKNALICIKTLIINKRVTAEVDNQAVVYAWNNQYSKNNLINEIMKEIFQLTFQQNCNLSLSYIHTSENPSDYLSRVYSKSDASISKRTWIYIQQKFGPHSVDMFSLDSNAMLDNEGFEISHFTPYKTPLSSGVDAFAQIYKSSEIYYAFPPFCLISAVVKFIIQEKITCTLIFPDFKPVKPWFTVILSYSKEIVTIGYKGDKGVLLYPSKKGFLPDKRGLQCNLCAAKFSFIGNNNTCADKYSKIISTNPQKFIPVLFIGDSIIRFLTDVYDNVHVVSNGGAKLMDSFHCLIRLIDILDVFVVIFHSGTNDLNKHFKPGDIQLKNAKKDIQYVFISIRDLQTKHDIAFVFSGCIKTCNDVVNFRINDFNTHSKELCRRFNFFFIDNSNISKRGLVDSVHLNETGRNMFIQNLNGFMS